MDIYILFVADKPYAWTESEALANNWVDEIPSTDLNPRALETCPELKRLWVLCSNDGEVTA